MNHKLSPQVPPLSVPPRAAWQSEQTTASPARRSRSTPDEQNSRRSEFPSKYEQLPSMSSRTQQVDDTTDRIARTSPAHLRPPAHNMDRNVDWQPPSPPTTHPPGEGYRDRDAMDHQTWARREGSIPDEYDTQRPRVPVKYETLPFGTDWTERANNPANDRVAETDLNHSSHNVDRHVHWQLPAKPKPYSPGEEYPNSSRATGGSSSKSELVGAHAGLAKYTRQLDEGSVTDAKSLARARHHQDDNLHPSHAPRDFSAAVGPRFRSATAHQQYGQFAGDYNYYNANAHYTGHHHRGYDVVDRVDERSSQVRADNTPVDTRQNLPVYHHHYSRGLW